MSNTLDKDLKGSKKDNPKAGLFTHYLSKDVFIMNPDITRTIFNPVNKNRSYSESWAEEDGARKNKNNKELGGAGNELIDAGRANVLMEYNDYNIEVSSNYLDKQGKYLHLNMNECFLLFGFIIQKFEDVNKIRKVRTLLLKLKHLGMKL